MTELSLHILDIAYNSIAANAKHITVRVDIDSGRDLMSIEIADDGKGMDAELLERVTNPFSTTRTTRRVGLGIPLFKAAAESAGGSFKIKSEVGKGTTTAATFEISNIDRMPLGDLAETVTTLISGAPQTEIRLEYTVDGDEYVFDTAEVRAALGEDIADTATLSYLKDMIDENLKNTSKGVKI